jgi:hypothetical protein
VTALLAVLRAWLARRQADPHPHGGDYFDTLP